MITYDKLFIGGAWVSPTGSGRLSVVDSTTEEVMGSSPEGEPDDVDRAALCARRAFETWSTTPVAERAAALERIAEGLAARQDELAELIAREVGMPKVAAWAVQAGLPVKVLRSFADLLRSYAFEETVGTSRVVREAYGVVGCITPWNFPLHQIVAKAAAALAAGCPVIVKPSEIAPLNAFVLAEVVEAAELPAGVFNLVSGLGPVVGEAMAVHPEIDMISFTGSTRAGARVAARAAPMVKRVTQELGGKSPNIILDDADLAQAVKVGVAKCFYNSGQTCSAWSRMLVHRDQADEAAAIAVEAAERQTVGNPLDRRTKLGPLVSEIQRERVRSYIRQGIEEGAQLLTGGPEPPDGLDRGYFVRPTVFAGVTPEMTIAREEIFGPVLAILAYEDDDDAVRIANDSHYGLAGGVWSGDSERAERVARRLRTGQVDINGGRFNLEAPFGGYKRSGNGREFGRWGLEEFLEIKSLQR